MTTDKEIHIAFEKSEGAVWDLFRDVTIQGEELAKQLAKQGEALGEWQARLAKHSRNSGKPPSSDGYKKPHRTESVQKSGNKPNGGQLGHAGQTLKALDLPDHIEMHAADICEYYQARWAEQWRRVYGGAQPCR